MSEDNVQNVNVTNMVPLHMRVTSIDIPFRDIFWLTFKALFATILVGIVLAIPLSIIATFFGGIYLQSL